MDELFGVSMDRIMVVLVVLFLAAMAVVVTMAVRNRVMVKLGLRNIPRRKTQTVLIIVGVMLSTVIIAAAFGTGDTISFSIRNEAVESLGTVDEIILSARATSQDSLGSSTYITGERFRQIQRDLESVEGIDGMVPQIAETAPVINPRTRLSEGRTRVAAFDPSLLDGFGTFTLVSGGVARLEDLAEDEVYISDKAAEELDAIEGDQLKVFVDGGPQLFTVKGIVERGGLAGRDPTLLLSLARAQAVFDRPDQLNWVLVSNRGDKIGGAELSDDVTRDLRNIFVDREVAEQIKTLLNRDDVRDALVDREQLLGETAATDLALLRQELGRDELTDVLVGLLADADVSSEVLEALDIEELRNVEREASTLFVNLGEFRVLDVKQRALDEADMVGSFVTTLFVIFGLFSIIVGVLLIFLIFVMLAAARRSEMGMARAVGAKRRHLVQMFVFEGTAYSLVSAAVGAVLGLMVAALMIAIVNRILMDFGEDFRMTLHFEPRSVIVAYCLGMVITFATIAVSAYRVSRLNIVAAVRDLPTPIEVSTTSLRDIILTPWRAFLRPFRLGAQTAVDIVTLHPLRAITHLLQAAWAAVSFPATVFKSLIQLLWRPFQQGWLAIILGLLLAVQGVAGWEQSAPFTIGASLMIIGIGLMARTLLRRTAMRADVRDRIAYTVMGVGMLIFWLLPFDTLEPLTGELQGDIEMFFISGVSMVAAAVWTVMYNADLLLKLLTAVTGRVGSLRPVLVTSVAYPMSAKFRTGLTLAMFALVIFTLIVMSILTGIFETAVEDIDTVTGGWDIQAELNFNTPIQDIEQAIADSRVLRSEDFEAIGGYTFVPIEARQIGAENQQWRGYGVRAADTAFLASTGYELKLIADGYGSSADEVWRALSNDPSLAVVDSFVVPTKGGGFGEGGPAFELEGFYYEDDTMPAVHIEVREPRTGEAFQLTVIGVLDQAADAFGGVGIGMITSKARLDEAVPFPVPVTTYRFRVSDGVDVARIAKNLEASFLDNGMETNVLGELIADQVSANRAFNYLLTGFMGLGLMVGIAALGVISIRAVVERRQQIGVLRAIGYRRGMVQLSFILESSFIALLGIAIGVGLGTVISYNIVNDIKDDVESIRFSVPWLQIAIIIGIAYLFAMMTTYLPARQASRIYPAEALRYE